MQKITANGRPMFNARGGEPVNPHPAGNGVTWSFSLQLQNAEEMP